MRNIFRISSLLVAVGAALMLMGSAMGADRQIYMDRLGVHVGTGRNERSGRNIKSSAEVSQLNIKKFSDIELNLISYGVEFVPDYHYGFEFQAMEDQRFAWSVENGTLKITERHDNGISFFNFDLSFLNDDYDDYETVRIYFPKDADLDRIDVRSVSGALKIYGVSASDLSAKTTSGSITIGDCEIDDLFEAVSTSGSIKVSDSGAEDMEVKGTSGSVLLDDVTAETLIIKTVSGSINANADIDKAIETHSTSGSTKLKLKGNWHDFSKSFRSTSGSIHIDGEQYERGYSDSAGSSGGKKLTASSTSGSIRVEFDD